MKTMPISQFKAHALKIIDRISKDQESMIITKRGRPIAQVFPYEDSEHLVKPGRLADTLVFEEDIVAPLGEEMWEACS